MTNLNLFQDQNVQKMSSREIAELTGKEHKNVLRDIRNILEQLQIEENSFLSFDNSGANNRQVYYYLLPKRECLILASGYNVNLRATIIDRWIELESKQSQELPQTFAEALQLAANQAKEIEALQPKAENYDKFINADSLQSFKEVANVLGWGRNNMMARLREIKILTGKNIPYQNQLDAKRFEVKESTQSGFNVTTTYVTPK